MRAYPIFALLLVLVSTMATANIACDKFQKPKLIKSLDNWDIIATTKAEIKIAPYFSGDDLSYSISYHAINPRNNLSIDAHSGVISVDAEAQDNFDLRVTAKNACGLASGRFNIQIDEEH
ncbi:cadherin repeat domain-containing protein [Legionella jordanis]|uniref:Cadherin domain-containing protein n=1 Tax=Legionella jordanis TaxID=456 RepID=A0A0W0VAV4_9GAMM|nr:cadherin repeat domain-containing protein [Legionella jordanis]KTD17265.1 hypothetical protein Ljor_1571 [Legionella jordanis]RMX03376.1 cadherin repeat domain-containing protein [Legionella jordanis]RMX15854.1 cadherin repeat domain-containing protein [Legionella jordanis]VEH12538.1 Uncharacterised protein [Legionella jordanis]HAT8713387.1 hypothetical protein [Legionella jordanis]